MTSFLLCGGKSKNPKTEIRAMPKTKKPLRKNTIKLSLNDDEYNYLNERKTRHHLASFIREVILNTTPQNKIINVDPALVLAVNRIGNNLNQLAKYTHQNSDLHQATASELSKIRVELVNLIELIKKDN